MFQQIGVATVEAVQIRRTGMFFDLIGQPTGEQLVGRMVTACGPDHGIVVPFEIDDTVLYAIPQGDPGDGAYVIGRFFEEAEPVPQVIVDNPNDEHWVAKAGRRLMFQSTDGTIRLLNVLSAGNSVVELQKNGDIVVGSGKDTVLGTTDKTTCSAVALFDALKTYIDGHMHLAGTLLAPMGGGAVTGVTGAPTVPLSASVKSANVYAKKP